MSLPRAVESPLGLTNVQNVAIDDNRLTWTSPAGSGEAKVEEVVLVLKSHGTEGSAPDYVILLLKESSEKPFQATVLEATKIPTALEQYVLRELPPHLREDDSNDVHTIVSSKSGTSQSLSFWQDVLRPVWTLVRQKLEPAPTPPTVGDNILITESAQSVRQFARQFRNDGVYSGLAKKSQTVVLLSGDGGVVDLLNGSDETSSGERKPVIAILPLGTGNALFHSVHKPLYSEAGPSPLVLALRTLFQGVPSDLPIFRASFSPGSKIVSFGDKLAAEAGELKDDAELSQHDAAVSYLNGAIVASYGFHASIVYESDTPEYRVHGSKRFGMVAQELLRESHPYKAQVKIRRPGSSDFEAIPRDTHAYVLSTLVSNLERGFTISPASIPLDGKLRLVHFGPVGGERTMEIMMKAYDNGSHVGLKWDDGSAVEYEEVDEVKVVALEEDARWRKVCIDGTIVEVPQGGYLSVARQANGPFRVVAPEVVKN